LATSTDTLLRSGTEVVVVVTASVEVAATLTAVVSVVVGTARTEGTVRAAVVVTEVTVVEVVEAAASVVEAGVVVDGTEVMRTSWTGVAGRPTSRAPRARPTMSTAIIGSH
jgi:predicted alpha-1,6-mannanase (GH76 family)